MKTILILSLILNMIAFACFYFAMDKLNHYAKQRNDLFLFVTLHQQGYTYDEWKTLNKQLYEVCERGTK